MEHVTRDGSQVRERSTQQRDQDKVEDDTPTGHRQGGGRHANGTQTGWRMTRQRDYQHIRHAALSGDSGCICSVVGAVMVAPIGTQCCIFMVLMCVWMGFSRHRSTNMHHTSAKLALEHAHVMGYRMVSPSVWCRTQCLFMAGSNEPFSCFFGSKFTTCLLFDHTHPQKVHHSFWPP